MYSFLLRSGRWLGRKLLVAALIVGLGLAADGLRMFVRDPGDFTAQRAALLQRLTSQREHLLAAQTEIAQRIVELQTGVEVQRDRAQRAQKVIDLLREMESWWDRLWGNPPQQKANAEQLKHMEEIERTALAKVGEWTKTLTQARWEKDGIEIELARVSQEVFELERSNSRVRHYLVAAWFESRWYLALALAAYFFGPTLWAMSMYYGFARRIAHGRPIQFKFNAAPPPKVSESRASVEVALGNHEVLLVRKKYLAASDESGPKKTRFVLDWHVPLTSVACGLTELVELRNGGQRDPLRVTLSNAADPQVELAVVEMAEGSALILLPSFLVGVIQRDERPLVIRRHWRILSLAAWVSGQFWFLEFVGPCQLIVAGGRGVKTEELAKRPEGPPFARRTHPGAAIGFTPSLTCRPVRAETFSAYYRGLNPLFDDLFVGNGLIIVQATQTRSRAGRVGQLGRKIWRRGLRVFGM